MKNIPIMKSEGLIPKRVWNEVALLLNQLKAMRGQGGIAVKQSPSGFEVSFIRNLYLPFTFSLHGLLVENAQNVCGKLYTIQPVTIHNIPIYVEAPSTNGSIDVDIHLCDTVDSTGVSLFADDTPSIPQDEYIKPVNIPYTANIPAGKFLQIDLDSVGEGAESLTVIINGT